MPSKISTIQYQRFQQSVSDDLIRRAQVGEMASHSELYRLFSQAIFTLANGICHNEHCAEDILQNVFVKLFEKVNSYEFRAPFGMWLRQLAVNECLMHLRRQKKHTAVLSTDEFAFTNLPDTEIAGASSKSELDVARLYAGQHDLSKMLSRLPQDVRLVLWLKEIEGYTHDEIARLVDKTPSYSKSVTHRAFKYLTESLKHETEDIETV